MFAEKGFQSVKFKIREKVPKDYLITFALGIIPFLSVNLRLQFPHYVIKPVSLDSPRTLNLPIAFNLSRSIIQKALLLLPVTQDQTFSCFGIFFGEENKVRCGIQYGREEVFTFRLNGKGEKRGKATVIMDFSTGEGIILQFSIRTE